MARASSKSIEGIRRGAGMTSASRSDVKLRSASLMEFPSRTARCSLPFGILRLLNHNLQVGIPFFAGLEQMTERLVVLVACLKICLCHVPRLVFPIQ